ncbi:hypothetical protein B0O99DRAFT_605126 [Bisporella sp. PMI_857]|nr:hypothetical protein B0O99DRAFT_605126 [Bisporella sp. PMI_857]
MSSKYQQIGDSEKDSEKFHDIKPRRPSESESLTSTLLDHEQDRAAPRFSPSERWLWLVHLVLLTFSFIMFVASFYNRASTLTYVKKFSAYSPAAEAIKYERIQFNDTMGEGSPYVGYGPEVDKAWAAITYEVGDQMITDEERQILDMPESSLKVKHPKTGVEGYRVGLEVFHQLHCVNVLRQVAYRSWYQDLGGEFEDGEEALTMHIDHCLEILRKSIQCNADVGLFTFYMMDGDPLPWPELDTEWHVCRNFDAVREWAIENSVGNMERPDIHPIETSR